MRHGFSLVELSIVLVILGLLTGGILAGQSLIRASELRAVSTEYARYITATQTFRDKYFAIPGDFRDATRFWNRLNTNGDCVSNSGLAVAGSPGACDGNGSGLLQEAGAASQSGEIFQYWRHLALAGLIEGTYSGLAGAGGAGWHSVIGTNAPASKLSSAGWSAAYLASPSSGATNYFNGTYTNFLVIGGSTSTGGTSAAILKPEEAWNIDTKMDDGKPATGNIVARDRVGCALTAGGAALTTAAGDAALMDATYNLASTSNACSVIFRNAF